MLNILFIILISFIPVVFWAYVFSSQKEEKFNKARFFLGIFSGVISVFPILYMDEFIDFVKIKSIDFFEYSTFIGNFFSSINFVFSLSLFLFFIVFLSITVQIFFKRDKLIFITYFRNFVLSLLFILIIFLVFYSLNSISSFLPIFNEPFNSSGKIYFGETIFNTFKLIIFYYVLVAFIEESSKHFNFIGTSILDIKSVQDGVLYAIFVALGFSFIENILYFYNLYNYDGLNFSLVKIYFLRSIFSIIVHVFCSSVIAYFFTKSYLSYKKDRKIFPYLKLFLFGLFISILLHFIFDIALTFGFTLIVIIYFIVGYLYISSIFYNDNY